MKNRAVVAAALSWAFLGPGAAAFDTDKFFAKALADSIDTLATSRSAEKRADAARWLGSHEEPEAIAALAAALSDRDVEVRLAAASALWDTGKAAAAAKPSLEGALSDADARVVCRAAGALASMGVHDRDLAPAWRRALSGAPDESTAFLSARGLVGIDPAAGLAPAILGYLATEAAGMSDPDWKARDAHEDNVELARHALDELLSADAASVMRFVERTASDAPATRKVILAALRAQQPPPPGSLALALGAVASPDPDVRAAAANLAGAHEAEADVSRWQPAIAKLLGDPETKVRSAALWAFRSAGPLAHATAPEVARLLAGEKDPDLREQAAHVLGEMGDARSTIPQAAKAAVAAVAREPLRAAMRDRDGDAASAAVDAFEVLALPEAEILAGLADVAVADGDPAPRRSALMSLRNMKGRARPVLERLRPLTGSPDRLVAEDARTAIEWIEGDPEGGRAAAPPAPVAPPSAHAEAEGLSRLRARGKEMSEDGFYGALSEADEDAVRAYLDAGMSPSLAFGKVNLRTPLMVLYFHGACREGASALPVTRLLLERGADVNAVDENGNTALMFAADACDRETLRLLLRSGAKLPPRNGSGLTALQMGVSSGNAGVEELIAAGARLDAQTVRDWTRAYQGNPKVLALVKKATPK